MVTQTFDTWLLDKAKRKKMEAQLEGMGLWRQMKNCLWLTTERLLYRLKQTDQLHSGVGLAADAITSRRAMAQGTKDGGREGWFRKMKPLFGRLNTCRESLEKCDVLLEELDVIRKYHNGLGKVAHTEINVRNAILLLEILQPDWEDGIPEQFAWHKAVFDDILGRPFNRTDWEQGEGVDAEVIEEAIAEYEELYPTEHLPISKAPSVFQQAFGRFCQATEKVKVWLNNHGVGWIVDDYWLELGDPCAA